MTDETGNNGNDPGTDPGHDPDRDPGRDPLPTAPPGSRAVSDAPGAPHDDAIVRLVDVHKAFGSLRVLKGVSIDFPRGRTTVVLGPSGCGKSVMLKHVIGLLRPDRGEVWYERERVDVRSESKLGAIRRQFGFLFQQSALFDSLPVDANVGFPLLEHTRMSKAERAERVGEVLRMVGLADTLTKMPAELSGGQRKRVALARAIVLEPRVILYDEPTTGLDPIRADVINELIIKLQSDLSVTSIVVTHDLTSAFKIADELVMLYDGAVVMRGPPDAFRETEIPLVRWFLKGQAPGGRELPPAWEPDDTAPGATITGRASKGPEA